MIISEKFPVKKILVVGILLVLGSLGVKGQRVYADDIVYVSQSVKSSPSGCGGFLNLDPCYNTVENPLNAKNNDNTYARVNSSSGLAAGLGAFQGEIELKFSSILPAGKTTYIRIAAANPNLLKALLGGSLGSLLTTVVGSVALGDKYFEVGARLGTGAGNNRLQANSQNGLTNNRVKLIQDANNFYYLAITPASSYDRVYIKDFTNALLGLGASNYTDVYYAFVTNGVDPCGTVQGFATSYEGTGLTLDLLGLGKGGVFNAQNVINSDQTDYSEISLGILGVAATMSQNVYFENLSNADDDLTLKLKVEPALLNLGLLNNITVTAFNGVDSVFTSNLLSNVNLDLLGLLNNGEITTIPLYPGVVYNRVKITIKSLLGVNLTQAIRLYAVNRTIKRPSFTNSPNSNAITVCSNTSTNIYATTDASNLLLWYDAITGGLPLATTAHNGFFPTPILNATKTYYVSAKKVLCGVESERVPITITVNTLLAGTISADQNACSGTVPTGFTAGSDVAAGTITYQWQKSVDNLSFVDIPSAILANYTETSQLTVKTYYRRKIFSTLNGVSCSAFSNIITITINQLPTFTPTTANVCKGTLSTKLEYTGTNLVPTTTYNITWNSLALSAGFLNISNAPLTGSPIIITVPSGVNLTTYTGSMIITNGNTCSSAPIPININVHNIPPSPIVSVQ